MTRLSFGILLLQVMGVIAFLVHSANMAVTLMVGSLLLVELQAMEERLSNGKWKDTDESEEQV